MVAPYHWMPSDETRRPALEKTAFGYEIGFRDTWIDYSDRPHHLLEQPAF